jgi:hypothetical protein
MYGDRDYQCNCKLRPVSDWRSLTSQTGLGGEAVSLAIKSQVSNGFHSAGYADIHTNATHIGGSVRQYGNLTFSRVYDAGHAGR